MLPPVSPVMLMVLSHWDISRTMRQYSFLFRLGKPVVVLTNARWGGQTRVWKKLRGATTHMHGNKSTNKSTNQPLHFKVAS